MKNFTRVLAGIGLGLTLFPAFFLFGDIITLDAAKNIMLAGTIFWFGGGLMLGRKQ